MSSRLHWPAGSAPDGRDPLLVSPERAGWRYAGLRVIRLAAGESRSIATDGCEMLVLPLSGGCSVELNGQRFELHGRAGVFSGISDYVYLPVDSEARVASGDGVELALPFAVASHHLPPVHRRAAELPVEVRGAGAATRQITNVFTAGTSSAHRLVVVEVLTPGGNWSSYPPHKHDDAAAGDEAELEEIYYFRIQGPGGFGVHRTYTADRTLDETVLVRDGDVFLVPRGYHGPCVAPPEYPMYYLNVLAGPGESRSLAFSDDPSYAWIRGTWPDLPTDPRVPLVGAPKAAL